MPLRLLLLAVLCAGTLLGAAAPPDPPDPYAPAVEYCDDGNDCTDGDWPPR